MNWNTLHNRSYVPYSGRPQACVAVGESGTHYPGVRIENISFPITISALQAAFFSCLSEGDTPQILLVPHLEMEQIDYWKKELNVEIKQQEDLPEQASWFDPLLPETAAVDDTLKTLLDKALVEYSRFPVAALLHTEKGYVSGVNIECSDWTLGLCAERVAIAKARAAGLGQLDELHIHTRYGEFSSPCGACRQVILEHLPHEPVILHHADETTSQHFTADLLPYSFKSEALQNKKL